jgi:hypothetical protein
MEQIMEKNMVKKLILVFVLFYAIGFSQTTPPSGYTPHYKFRMWSQGARPSADSLNQNWKDIDSVIFSVAQKTIIDTIDIAYKSRSNSFTKYNDISELAITKYFYYNYNLFEPMSGTYYALQFDNMVNAFIYSGYDTVKVYSINNWDKDGQILVIINLMGREKYIRLYHDKIQGTKYKMLLPNENDLLIPYLGSVTLMAIDNGSERKYYLISKTF